MENIILTGNDAAVFMQKMLHPNAETIRLREAFMVQLDTDNIDHDGLRTALIRRNQTD